VILQLNEAMAAASSVRNVNITAMMMATISPPTTRNSALT